MKLSVVVPVYNVEAYIDDCLHSLQIQDYSDYEIICVNDGSTDRSREMLSEWESRLPQMKVIDRANGGLSAARNTGLAAATGDYVVFVDSDDWVEPTMLSRLSEEVKGEDMICFACRKSDCGATDTLAPENSDGWTYYNQHALEHRTIPFVCVWQRCYRRMFLIENNLCFREGILHEDNEFVARSVSVIPDVLYNYRVRPGSIMTTRGLQSKKSLIIMGNELSEFFSVENNIDRTVVYQALTQCYQAAFINNTHDEDRLLRQLVNWKCYKRVSRTKPRHRLQFMTLRLSASLFRFLNHLL